MNILSLFNGISGLHLACDRAGINVDTCYYSEIDKYANKVTEHHYPDDVALGDVTKWREWDIDWASIDLVGAGFPCQAWSVAGQQLGDKDERGALFWTTLEIIAHVLKHKPSAKFLMENVKMKKDFERYITHHTCDKLMMFEYNSEESGENEYLIEECGKLPLFKTLINSALVSAQNRNRYYWTNFEVTQPDDKGILLKDILEDGFNGRDKSQTILATIYKENAKSMVKRNKMGLVVGGAIRGRYNADGTTSQQLECNGKEKTNSLTTVQKDNVAVYEDMTYRKLTPLECERLQTLPDNWTDCISNTQRYKSIGNGWTIDVIAHILKHI